MSKVKNQSFFSDRVDRNTQWIYYFWQAINCAHNPCNQHHFLLADSSRNLVLPILEYGYFLQFDEEPPLVKIKE
jgi:hypothetical protein